MTAFFFVSRNIYYITVKGIHPNSGRDITQYSNSANTRTSILKARRGFIYDKNGNVLAQDSVRYTMYAILDPSRPNAGGRPAYVEDKVKTAKELSEILNCDINTLINILNQDKYQVEFGSLGRNLSAEIKEEIESKDLPGIEFREVSARFYPEGTFASHLIGFAQYDDQKDSLDGKMGIELLLNEELEGEDGYTRIQVNTEGYALPGALNDRQEAENGSDVYLTLDKSLQTQLQASFAETKELFEANSVWGSVMEVETGRILACGATNDFDLNLRDIEDYSTILTQYAYEPGSVMKTFTYAAAIDSGVYHGSDTFNSKTFYMGIENKKPVRVSRDSGKTIYGTINNSRNRNWGVISFDLGYRYSSNVGIACLLSNYLDNETFVSYLDAFGFFKKVGFENFSEEVGVRHTTHPLETITAGFGQGSSVTMLQLLQAYSAIFNDGKMVRPYLVEEIKNSNTNEIEYLAQTDVVNEPIKPETAKKMQSLMYDVVNTDDGSGKHYRVNETTLIAKTGTAQYAVKGSYDSGKVITSVVIALPAEDPKIMVYYAFLSDYSEYLHTYTGPVCDLVRKISLSYGYSRPEEKKQEDKEEISYSVFPMPNLYNHTLDYAQSILKQNSAKALILGEGDQILQQYPDSGSIISNHQTIILLTSHDDIRMPDVIGFSRKDIMALWDMVGLAVSIKGEGKIVRQSIAPGNLIYPNSLLEVELE